MEIQEVFNQAVSLIFSPHQVSGCLGILPAHSKVPFTFFSKEKDEIIEAETIAYLQTHEIRMKGGSPILDIGTPHAIHGVVFSDGSVSSFYSTKNCTHQNQAVAFICGYYQYFKNKRGSKQLLDDTFFDMLLLGIGEEQKEYFPKNENIITTSLNIFKPEVFRV